MQIPLYSIWRANVAFCPNHETSYMYRGKIMHDKYAIYARSVISRMHDAITTLAYTSRNRLNFAYTDEILFASVCMAYFRAPRS